jgi:hypothetical protein
MGRRIVVLEKCLYLRFSGLVGPTIHATCAIKRRWNMGGQCRADGTLDGAENRALVAELHLRLGRVHIHIYHRRINVYVDNTDGKSAHHQERVIGLLDSI